MFNFWKRKKTEDKVLLHLPVLDVGDSIELPSIFDVEENDSSDNCEGFLSDEMVYSDDPEEKEARQLFWQGQNRLLTEEEFAKVMAQGYMNPREGTYQDDDRWNEWHAFLALQQIYIARSK